MTTDKLGGIGLNKQQLIDHIKRRMTETDERSDVKKDMYDAEDLSLMTETHAQMVLPKVRMKMILHAIDLTRKKPLVQTWIEDYNTEMVSFKRQGRLEYLGAMQALEASATEEQNVPRT
jgi:hypothetical protein